MTRARAALVACVLLAACGDGTDGGVRDAGAPLPCLLRGDLADPPSDFAACGVCVEPYVRLPFPTVLDLAGDLLLTPVPDGVIVTFAGTFVTFVTLSGEVHRFAEVPGDVIWPEGYFGFTVDALPVPGSTRVWIVRGFSRTVPSAPGPDIKGVASLLDYEGGRWRQIATADTPALFSGLALPDGSLVAIAQDRSGEVGRLSRLRATDAGGIETFERPLAEVWDSAPGRIRYLWRLVGGLLGALVETGGSPRDTVLLRLDESFAVVGDVQVVTPSRVDPAFEVDQAPFVLEQRHRPDGELSLLLLGTVRGLDAAPLSHLWVNRVSAAGELRRPRPGTWVNPDVYVRTDDLLPGAFRAVEPALDVLPGGLDGVVWSEHIAEREHHAQVLDTEGELLFEGGALRPAILAYSTSPRVYDGRSNTYVSGPSLLGPDYGVIWTTGVHSCPDVVLTSDGTFAGAYDEGLWIAWIDAQHDMHGVPASVVKVALIRPDGSFAWAD